MIDKEHMMMVNSLTWAHERGIFLRDGIRFDLSGVKYLQDIINCDKRISNCKKGAQMCLTTAIFLNAVHSCKYRKYNQNIMYLMPTFNAMKRLSQVSFDPIFQYNPWIMNKGDTNTVECKEINGRSIVMVGAQPKKVGGSNTEDSDNLRSIPCDEVDRDELDLMNMNMAYQAKQRLLRSEFGIERNFGTPTFPNFGIDLAYNNSDQRKWKIPCRNCQRHTCLVENFPKCIRKIGGDYKRACIHCGNEIFVEDGGWEADYPKRREAGFWVSGLLSPYARLDDYMWEYENTEGTKRSEFMRSKLGIAATEAEHQLDEVMVMSRCSSEINKMVSTGETVMGVDINKTINVVIGTRIAREAYDISHIGEYNDLHEVHDIALKMNVHTAVIDSGPYDHGVREFQRTEPYTIYLCQYSEQMPGKPIFDGKKGLVKVNRNEWCDKVHMIFSQGSVSIPRPSITVNEYAKQMTKTAKTIITHPDTGLKKPRWIPLGDDHYFHATLYFLLAAGRQSPRPKGTIKVNRPSHSISYWK